MPNLATLLKSEVLRLARKEVRNEVESLKKASSQYRGEIAQAPAICSICASRSFRCHSPYFSESLPNGYRSSGQAESLKRILIRCSAPP